MTENRPKILVVEDNEINIDIIVSSLKDMYDLTIAIDGHEALELVGRALPDLILLDVMMPGMSGYDVCRRLKAEERTRDIPVIFLTAINDILDKAIAFDIGAVDYLTKPFEILELKARVKSQLELKFTKMMLKDQNKRLEEMVRERTDQLYKTQMAMIYALASLAETRDAETGEHIQRTQKFMCILAMAAREQGHFEELRDADFVQTLSESAPLHDIGKVGVADEILLKPGKLTHEEFEQMKLHAAYGYKTLSSAEAEIGGTSFLTVAKEIAYTHHERWDGTGYPQGLAGDAIPLSGRLMALVDVYDALVSERPYKKAFTHETARKVVLEGSGTHFDPRIVEAFLSCEAQFMAVAKLTV